MSTELKKLARHSLVYGIGSSLGAIGSFLLIPLYTHSLNTDDYGALELLYSLCSVLSLITFMGVRQAYIRFYFDKREDEEWREVVTGSTLLFVTLACVGVLSVFLLFRHFLLLHLFQGHVQDTVFLLAVAWIPLSMLVDTGLTFFQIQMRSTVYVAINATQSLIFILSNFVLVYWLHYQLIGVFVAQILATSLMAITAMYFLLKTTRLRISFPLIAQMIKFGLPFLPTTLFMYVIKNADRYSLGLNVSLHELGVYALAAKIGMLGMMLCMDPFLKVWSPFLFENYSKPDGNTTISRVLTLFTALACFIAVGLAVVSPIALPLVTGAQYEPAFPLIPVTALATVFYGLSNLSDAGILISKKTQYKPLIFGMASLIAVAANFSLVPIFGIWGAAFASMISMAGLVAVNLHFSNRFYRLPIDWPKMVIIFAVTVGTYLVCDAIFAEFGKTILGQMGSLAALALFPVLLWMAGLITPDEVRGLAAMLKKNEALGLYRDYGGRVKAVLFKSKQRFDAFHKRLRDSGVEVVVLDFDLPAWVDFNFSDVDIVIYFPSFAYTSNHPQALYRVQDNLMHIHRMYPHVRMFPDPNVIPFYSDKYRQSLFLRSKGLPYPETYALSSEQAIAEIAERLGFPMVVKNRFGAGGDFVFKVTSRAELLHWYRMSQLDLFRLGAARHYLKMLSKRVFYYYLIRERSMAYPFFSPPLLAQKFVPHDRDIKTVVGEGKVVEAHWRGKADEKMWKVNIDGGGIGEWSYVPQEIIDISEKLAAELKATWLNIDIIQSDGRYVITEFSPVWHHYAYKEKPSFVYKDDYNINVPLEIALDLERIIVESLVRAAEREG